MLRAVDLHQFAQAIAPPARLMRRGQAVPPIGPQPIRDHPTAQGLARDRAAMVRRQLLRRQGRAEVGIPLAHKRQRQRANLAGQPMIARLAAVPGNQARGTVLLEAAQQTKHLTPPQPDQRAGIGYPQPAGLHAQQHLKPAELLLAHRHHRHGAPPGTPEPGGVSPLFCRGVSSLYCGYTRRPHNRLYDKSTHDMAVEVRYDTATLPCCIPAHVRLLSSYGHKNHLDGRLGRAADLCRRDS